MDHGRRQPILREVDTIIGAAVGVVDARISLKLRHCRSAAARKGRYEICEG
jgi:hypothetical protein